MKHSKLYEEIYNQLPRKWSDITLQQFQKLMKAKVSEDQDELNGIYNTIEAIHQLTGVSHEEIEALSMLEVSALANKMEFLTQKMEFIDVKQCRIKWLKIEEISMDKYIQFIQTPDHMVNLANFIKNFSTNGYTDEEIQELPIQEVMTGFFLFRKMLMKSIINSAKLTHKRIKQLMKEEQHSNLKGTPIIKKYISKLGGIFSQKK